jgi:hypothetical protein
MTTLLPPALDPAGVPEQRGTANPARGAATIGQLATRGRADARALAR